MAEPIRCIGEKSPLDAFLCGTRDYCCPDNNRQLRLFDVDERRRPLKLILASASPRRRLLLKKLRIPFRVIPSRISESSSIRQPARLVRELALRKARAVAKMLQEGVVLGADTLVICRGKILGKPRNQKHAYRMLFSLAGTTHRVYTGVSLVDAKTGKSWITHEMSAVRMKKLPPHAILKLARKHLDKAGSYAIQEKRDPIARVVRGSYDNVVGLPVRAVRALLRKRRRAA